MGGGLADVGLVGVCGEFGAEVGCLIGEVVCFSAEVDWFCTELIVWFETEVWFELGTEVMVGLGTEFEVCFIGEGDGDALDIVDALQSE